LRKSAADFAGTERLAVAESRAYLSQSYIWSVDMPPKNEVIKNGLAPLARPPLLLTESADEYAALLASLWEDIKPTGPVEQFYVEEIAAIIWEIQRLRRCKVDTITKAIRPALRDLLRVALYIPGTPMTLALRDVTDFVDNWFRTQKGKKEVLKILVQYGLDETAIEAEAIKLSSSDLEMIERMQTSQRLRLDKTFGCIVDYRKEFGNRVRQGSKRILENDDTIAIAASEAA
jgi:hypothetical protein